jgi:C4-dicarboxylate-specific signal transduction histidine kinase
MECLLAILFMRSANSSIAIGPIRGQLNLNRLIEQVISLQAPDVRDKGVAIDCELDPDLPVAFTDAAQIQQVLFNLLMEAYEAMSRSEEPKKLTLRTDYTNDHVRLEVENNGDCDAVVADEPRGTVVAPQLVDPLLRRKGVRSKLFDEKEE